MFENRSQQSKAEVNARTEEIQNSSHEQTCFLLKKKQPVEYRKRLESSCKIILTLNWTKSEYRKTLEITKIEDQ